MDQVLFREEALAAQRDKAIGNLLASRGTTLHLVVPLVVVFFFSATVLILCVQYTTREQVKGYLEPDTGLVKIRSPHDGVVASIIDRPAGRVREGQVLAVINSDLSLADRPSLQEATETLITSRRRSTELEGLVQRRMAETRGRDLRAQIADGVAQTVQIGRLMAIQEKRLQLLREDKDRKEKLQQAGYTVVSEVQRTRDALLEQEIRMEELRRDLGTKRASVASLSEALDLTSLDGESKSLLADRAVDELAQEAVRLKGASSIAVRAPVAGELSSVPMKIGQPARTQTTLATIVPEGATLQATLLVPTRAIGFVRPGQSVALRLDAFPYQRFGVVRGIVSRVDGNLIDETDESVPVKSNEPNYKVTVKLPTRPLLAYGKPVALKEGMLLQGDIELERHSLIGWLLKPIISFIERL